MFTSSKKALTVCPSMGLVYCFIRYRLTKFETVSGELPGDYTCDSCRLARIIPSESLAPRTQSYEVDFLSLPSVLGL